MKENDAATGTFHCGLALLRIWMCFEVVLDHFYTPSGRTRGGLVPDQIHGIFGGIAVPAFMLLSFFLTDTERLARDRGYFRKRLYRLLVPQALWAVVYWLFYLAFNVLFHGDNPRGRLPSLCWQLLLGHSSNRTMWFQTDLIILTLCLTALFKTAGRQTAFLLLPLLAVLAGIAEYSGLNYRTFAGLPGEAQAPLGRLCEMLPFAAAGILLRALADMNSRRGLVRLGGRQRLLALLCLASGMAGECRFPAFRAAAGFGYQGLHHLAMGLLLFGGFSLLPPAAFSPAIQMCIKVVSRYTMGIYCGHRLIGVILLNEHFPPHAFLQAHGYLLSAAIFLLCWIFSWLCAKLPCRWVKVSVS